MKNRKYAGLLSARCVAGAAGVAMALQAALAADGNIVLHTGGATTPVTDSRVIEAVTGPNAWVEFNFGIATAEQLIEQAFFDSVTFTLQGSVPSSSATIVTADRTGALWAPFNPGGITLDPSTIRFTEISFPQDLNPELSYRRAFAVSAPIPQELFGQPLTFIVDLFDNQNGIATVAYSTSPNVVPEPTALLLAFVGSLFVFGLKWRKE